MLIAFLIASTAACGSRKRKSDMPRNSSRSASLGYCLSNSSNAALASLALPWDRSLRACSHLVSHDKDEFVSAAELELSANNSPTATVKTASHVLNIYFHISLGISSSLPSSISLSFLNASRSPSQVKKMTKINIATIGILSGLVTISRKLCSQLGSSIKVQHL